MREIECHACGALNSADYTFCHHCREEPRVAKPPRPVATLADAVPKAAKKTKPKRKAS